MDSVLADYKYAFCLVYVDDIIVHSDTFEQHLTDVARVLNCIILAGLRMKFEKCSFAVEEIKFLGKIVNGNAVSIDPRKVTDILNRDLPTKATSLHRFVSMVVYHSQHIPDYGNIARPLYHLLKKDTAWHWSQEAHSAWEMLGTALAAATMNHFPEEGCPMILKCNASKRGIGAALYKIKDNKELLMIFLARLLSMAERIYLNTEREGLAIYWAITSLEHTLWGMQFTVEADHSALLSLAKHGNLAGQWARWRYQL